MLIDRRTEEEKNVSTSSSSSSAVVEMTMTAVAAAAPTPATRRRERRGEREREGGWSRRFSDNWSGGAELEDLKVRTVAAAAHHVHTGHALVSSGAKANPLDWKSLSRWSSYFNVVGLLFYPCWNAECNSNWIEDNPYKFNVGTSSTMETHSECSAML